MVSKEQEELNNQIYLSLGKFVVSFSHLLHALEESTIFLFGLGPDGARTILIKAALTDRTAYPISSAFFSVFFQKWGDLVTDDDLKIMKVLRKEIQDLIEKRNRIMHDAWMGQTVGGDPGPHPMSLLRVRAHGKGADYESREYVPEAVRLIAEDAKRLASVVNGIVWYTKPNQKGPEVNERFEVREERVFHREAKA